jgi:hypothetical protein
MLVDEKDGDVLTLGVLVERCLDTLNFRLWGMHLFQAPVF